MNSLLHLFVITIAICDVYSYSKIVNKLKNYVESNETFYNYFKLSLSEYGYKINNFYQLFDEYLHIAPGPTNLTFIYDVLNLTSYSQTGSILANTKFFQDWIRQYMTQRGDFCYSPRSKYIVPMWQSWSMINMSQYIIPKKGYQSYNDFFTRKIKPETHPIQSKYDNHIITSSVDGLVTWISQNATDQNTYNIKNVYYNLTQMFGGNKEYALKYEGGAMIQIELRRFDYHRYHSSISGNINWIQLMDGCILYYPVWNNSVDPYDPCKYPSIFLWSACNNQRGIVMLKNENIGFVTHVFVGMSVTSSVNINVEIGDYIEKGDEIGYFALGGSTMVVLFEPNVIQTFNVKKGDVVRMGQAMATTKYHTKKEQVINNNQDLNVVVFIELVFGIIIILYILTRSCYYKFKLQGYQPI